MVIGERNSLEIAAKKFGFSNSDCRKDARLARLVAYKAKLDSDIAGLMDVDVRRLGKLVALTDVDYSDQRLYDLLKGILASRRHLATLRPKKAAAKAK